VAGLAGSASRLVLAAAQVVVAIRGHAAISSRPAPGDLIEPSNAGASVDDVVARPAVHVGEQQRDNEHEPRLRAQIGQDLPVEPELDRWFPLWGIPV
jgi:hypothetical protein